MKPKKSIGLGFSFKQLLFAYLAVTKVMYWIGTIAMMDNLGEFGGVFINRMINQDIMTIVILVTMFSLEARIFSKTSENNLLANVKLYAIGLIIYLALIVAYNFLLGLFIDVSVDNWLMFIVGWIVIFVIISLFLHLKEKLKKKETEMYLPSADTDEGKIFMLKSLCDTGVLTQEEFEEKHKKLGIE